MPQGRFAALELLVPCAQMRDVMSLISSLERLVRMLIEFCF